MSEEIKFPSNAEVYVHQQRNLQLIKDDKIAKTVLDFQDYGIVLLPSGTGPTNSKNFALGGIGTSFITVGYILGSENGGIAWDGNGKRICISSNIPYQSTTFTPPVGSNIETKDPYNETLRQVSGNYNIPLVDVPGVTINYVYIEYLQVVDSDLNTVVEDSEPSPRKWYTKYKDGYAITVYSTYQTPTPTKLYLGKVNINSVTGLIESVDESDRTYCRQRPETIKIETPASSSEATQTYTSGSTYSLADHIKAIGTGTITPTNPHAQSLSDFGIGPDALVSVHQQRLHNNGLVNITDPVGNTSTALYPSVSGTQLSIKGLGESEYLVVQTVSYSKTDTVIHNVSGVFTEKTFGDEYGPMDFSGISVFTTYYFYIDTISPSQPVLTYSTNVAVCSVSTNYVVCAVDWDGVSLTLHDRRTFRNLTGLNLWRTAGRIAVVGMFGHNIETGKFEGYNNDGTWTILSFPKQYVMWHDESEKVSGNDIISVTDTAQRYNTLSYQNPSANGDVFTNQFYLEKGTYTLYVLGRTTPESGKIQWSIDDVNIGSEQDWYDAVGSPNVIKTITSINITVSGQHTLKSTVTGKHVASSGYDIKLTKIWIK